MSGVQWPTLKLTNSCVSCPGYEALLMRRKAALEDGAWRSEGVILLLPGSGS